jgi:predicted aspartyl protease/tetratricopeptide (TPR) repeat protein
MANDRIKRTLTLIALVSLLNQVCPGASLAKSASNAALPANTPASAGTVAKARSVEKSAPIDVKLLSEQILAAYGGYKKMKELDAMAFKSVGDLKQYSTISGACNNFETETISKGEMLRSKIELMGQPMVTGYDGKQCWIQQGEHVFPADETTTQRIVEEVKHGMVLLMKLGEPGARIEAADRREVDGHPCSGLKIYADDGKPSTFYADDTTHYILRSEYVGTDLEQGVSAVKVCEYTDNRPIFGSVMPYHITEFSNEKKSAETEIKSIVESKADDSIFSIPSEKPIARLKEGPVTIPFEYLSNEIVVRVTINDSQTLRFLVDTGATQSILDQEVAGTLGKFKPSNISMTTGAGSVAMNYMSLDKVAIGDVTLSNVPVAVTSLASFDHLIGARPAGLIGANILKRFLITFDYEKKQLILRDPSDTLDLTNVEIVKTKPALGVSGLAVEGTLDGAVPVTCLVDTGAAFNNISEAVVKSILPSSLLPMGDVLGLDGRRIKTSSVRFKNIKLGEISVNNPVFSVASQSAAIPAGIFSGGTKLAVLGNPFWSRYRMTVDYRGQRLLLQTTPEKRKANALTARIETIQQEQLVHPDTASSIKGFLRLAEDAKEAGFPNIEALAKASSAALEWDIAAAKNDSEGQEIALKRFDDAMKLAESTREAKTQAQVASIMSMSRLKHAKSQEDFVASRKTLGAAAKLGPTEPLVMVAAGLILVQLNHNDMAEKVFNQALTLEPTNWAGLWAKYRLAKATGQTDVARLVAEQLRHYYPQAKEVMALSTKTAKPAAKAQSSIANPANSVKLEPKKPEAKPAAATPKAPPLKRPSVPDFTTH